VEYFRAIVATPLLSLFSLVSAIQIQRQKSTMRQKIHAAYALFVVIGVTATNLLYLSYDTRAFGNEFGLYLFGLLPFLLLMSISGVWGAIGILRSPSLDIPLKPMSIFALLFVVMGMFGALFGQFPPGYDFLVKAYASVSIVLAVFWFFYGQTKLPTWKLDR